MSWTDVFKVIGSVIFSLGGASALILFFSSWLGKVWANRILAEDKARYQREIEALKNHFNKQLAYYENQLELARSSLSRYSENQFYLYSELWGQLCDLKNSGDRLWNMADNRRLLDFSKHLRKTKEHVMKGALLIEEEHYCQLTDLLDEFSNFNFNKKRLIDLRQVDVGGNAYTQALGEFGIIEENKNIKDNYDRLLVLIKESFQKRIKGDFSQINTPEANL